MKFVVYRVNLYLKAAEKGDDLAQLNVGMMYFGGKGTKQDYAQAMSWLVKSAEQGNIQAQNAIKDITALLQ